MSVYNDTIVHDGLCHPVQSKTCMCKFQLVGIQCSVTWPADNDQRKRKGGGGDGGGWYSGCSLRGVRIHGAGTVRAAGAVQATPTGCCCCWDVYTGQVNVMTVQMQSVHLTC